jgi:hypothetical protein
VAPHNPTRDDQAEVEDLRREMARIRREIHADVNVAAEHLNATLNWRGYIRSAPWPAVGAAFGVGFAAAWLLVPRRRIRVVEREEAGRSRPSPRYEQRAEERAEEKAKRKGLLSMALGFAAPIAMRAAQNYAIQFIEGRLAESQWGGLMPDQEGSRVQPDQSAPWRPD